MTRGRVLGLMLEQVAARARYLGGICSSGSLDALVRSPASSCIDGYYELHEHNGGKDPTAPDPFDRWPHGVDKVGQPFTAITGDCIGGAAWCGGFDRYQPSRFAHLYDGWINTDSMIEDALGPAKCFELLHAPVAGCFMVAPTGAPSPFSGCGHISTVYDAPPPDQWDIGNPDAWRHVLAVDVAARGEHRANMPTTGAVWYPARYTAANPHKFTIFCRSIMTP